MKTYNVFFEYRMQGEDSTSYDTRTVSIEIKAIDSVDATDKLRTAFQRLVDSAPACEPDPPHVATVCAGCGRPGSSTEEIPPGEVALHWVVRGVWVCIDCWQKNQHPNWVHPSDPHEVRRADLMVRDAGPSRDEFVRALANVLDAYDYECRIPSVESAEDTAMRALNHAHITEARKLLALCGARARACVVQVEKRRR